MPNSAATSPNSSITATALVAAAAAATAITPTDAENRLAPKRETSPKRAVCSAPQSRCNSWRDRHRHASKKDRRSAFIRANSASMPDCSARVSPGRKFSGPVSPRDCPMCTVRSFTTTSKGIIESGSFYRSVSANSLLSSGSLATTLGSGGSNCNSRSESVDRTDTVSVSSNDGSDGVAPSIFVTPSYFRTLILGSDGVGKTTLIDQLTRLEPSTLYSQDEDSDGSELCSVPVVSVQLDGLESTMEFIDGADCSDIESFRADAFVIIYAISEPESFHTAAEYVNHLRQELGTDRPIFLVANKTDLVRQRIVPSQESKKIAVEHECHFLEISTSLNINLDELLVSVLCSIKRKLTPVHGTSSSSSDAKLLRSNLRPRSSGNALSAIGNFLKHACRRDSRRGDQIRIPQVV